MTFKTRSEAENVPWLFSSYVFCFKCDIYFKRLVDFKHTKFFFFFCQAANQGAKFKGRILQISWYKPKTPSVSTEPEEEESKEEVNAAGIHVMTVTACSTTFYFT